MKDEAKTNYLSKIGKKEADYVKKSHEVPTFIPKFQKKHNWQKFRSTINLGENHDRNVNN